MFQVGDKVTETRRVFDQVHGLVGTVTAIYSVLISVRYGGSVETLHYYETELKKVDDMDAIEPEEIKPKFQVGDKVWVEVSEGNSLPVGEITEVEKAYFGFKYKVTFSSYLLNEEHVHKYDDTLINPYSVGDYVVFYEGATPIVIKSVEDQFYSLGHAWYHFSQFKPYEPCEAVKKWGGFYKVTDNDYEGLKGFIPRVNALYCYDPEIVVDGDKLKISLFQNRKDYERGRRTELKVGRAVRMLYPEYSDKEVHMWVDKINERFTPRSYTLHTGKLANDFVHAYVHEQSWYANPRTTASRKCLADSCMRYDFVGNEGFMYHPVEAYASGDFMIVWCEDTEGRIASRSVVAVHGDKWVAGPVYGVCEKSLDMIEDYIRDNGGYLFKDQKDWTGARVVKLEEGHGRYIGPYFDSGECLRDDGKFFVVDPNGSIGTSDHQGYFEYDSRPMCYACDHREHPDYMMYSEDGHSYCEGCYHDRFTFCEEDNCEINADDAVYVAFKRSYGTGYMTVHSDYAIQCSYSDEWWHINDIVEDYHGEPVSPEYAYGNLSLCESSGKWCEADETVVVSVDNEQQVWHKDELSDDYVESDGVYYLKEELEKEAA